MEKIGENLNLVNTVARANLKINKKIIIKDAVVSGLVPACTGLIAYPILKGLIKINIPKYIAIIMGTTLATGIYQAIKTKVYVNKKIRMKTIATEKLMEISDVLEERGLDISFNSLKNVKISQKGTIKKDNQELDYKVINVESNGKQPLNLLEVYNHKNQKRSVLYKIDEDEVKDIKTKVKTL